MSWATSSLPDDARAAARCLTLLERVPHHPFDAVMARDFGLTASDLRFLVAHGLVRHPVRSAYVPAFLPDVIETRIETLKLLVPSGYIVTDRTAGWAAGASMVLAPNEHLVPAPLSVFGPPGHRMRNVLCASGERQLRDDDVMEIDGLLLTTPLRTACDLARLLPRHQAIGAMDQLARLGTFEVEEVVESVQTRFKGMRGIVQARGLAPVVDGGAESQPESSLRLHWCDLGLPPPSTQVPVPSPTGGWYYLDVGNEEHRIAAEYDGEEFHTDLDAAHDEHRRDWCRHGFDYVIAVARRGNLYGRHQDVDRLLRGVQNEARLRDLDRPA